MKYKNTVTGNVYTEQELSKLFDDVKDDLRTPISFEDWLDEEARKARHGEDGLEEVTE